MDKHNYDKQVERDEKGRPTKAWLEWAYLEQGYGIRDIARITERSQSGILHFMDKYEIKRRNYSLDEKVSREWLEQKYVVERISYKEVAKLAGVKPSSILYLVERYGLPAQIPKTVFEPLSKEWLEQKYVVEGLSSQQICEMTGYNKKPLNRLLKEYGITRKGWSLPKLEISREELHRLHVVEGLTAVRIAQRFGCHNSAISRLIKQYNLDPGRPLVNVKKMPPLTRDELWKLYWVDQLSAGEIATKFGVTRSTALRWFKQLEVPARKWNGGDFQRAYTRTTNDRKRYEFNAEERNAILDRDEWRCQMPGCHCSDAWKLEVHHILPIELGGDNALTNGITLCKDCHNSIRRREQDFILIFQDILNHKSS